MIASSHFAKSIATLYAETELLQPNLEQPIAPVGDLLRNVGLAGVELVQLTVKTASDFLLKQGGSVEPLPDLTSEPLAGFLCVVPGFGGCVFVERHDLFARRRFSAAHELGHYWLHFRPRLLSQTAFEQPMLDVFLGGAEEEIEPGDLPLGQISLPNQATDSLSFEQMEQEANQFAAELLIPANVVETLYGRYYPAFTGEDLARRLAGDFLVSRAAMRWRLRHLGLGLWPASRAN